MNASIAASLAQLRAADPAAGSDVAALGPDWSSVLAGIDADYDAAEQSIENRPAARRRQRRRLKLAAVAVLVVVAATLVGVIAWPGSSHGPAAIAYGVTAEPDGTVAVRRSPTQPFTAPELQSQLRAAGVPADVLVAAPGRTCTEPLPESIPATGQVVTYPSTIGRGNGFLIHPGVIPAGAVLVVVLSPVTSSGVSSTQTPAFAGLYVTLHPPTCVGQPSASSRSSPSK